MKPCRSLKQNSNKETNNKKFEQHLRKLHDQGHLQETVTLVLKHYGPELVRFSNSLCKDADAAADIYSQTCLDVWTGIDNFRWESSLRTWVYKVTRSACCRHYVKQKRDVQKLQEFIALSPINRHAKQIRTQTKPHFKTENKCAIATLRKALSQEEQTLLFLRIEQRMHWEEIVLILSDVPATDAKRLKRVIPTYRKRFERTKNRLRKLAEEAGLLKDDSPDTYPGSYCHAS